MQVIPLQPVPNQTLFVQLSGQNSQINVYTKQERTYLDLLVNNTLIVGGVICQNLTLLVRYQYLGFIGNLGFFDNQGSTNPIYTGLGTRYSLIYLDASDL